MSLELICPVTSLWGASLYGCNDNKGEAKKIRAMAGNTPSLGGGIQGRAAGRRPGNELTPALSAGHTTPTGFGTPAEGTPPTGTKMAARAAHAQLSPLLRRHGNAAGGCARSRPGAVLRREAPLPAPPLPLTHSTHPGASENRPPPRPEVLAAG